MPLGFDFPLFGKTFDNVQVSLNGWLTFDTNLNIRSIYDSAPTPDLIEDHPQRHAICPYWTNLHQTLQYGSVFCKYIDDGGLRGFVVQWHDVQVNEGDTDTSMFFQCILMEDGTIKFLYWAVGDRGNGANATIGIAVDDKFVEYSSMSASIGDGFGIEFTANLTPPPIIKRTAVISRPLFTHTTDTDVPVFQFFVEPRLSEGTIDKISLQVEGNKDTNTPSQQMYVYIVHDTDANGLVDEGDPVVSGLNPDDSPRLGLGSTMGQTPTRS
ncbi:MAG: hypothetical protein U5N86_08055 [Planctomycetota bacterium]|nr:hypothetical protein [Planctomycetota bacterium]